MNEDLDKLEVSVGDPITAEHDNELRRSIKRRTIQGGNGVLISQFDDHVQVSYRAPWTPSDRHAWKPMMSTLDGKPALRFARGLINGIEPTLGDYKAKLSDPFAPVIPLDFDPDTGDCGLYLELSLAIDSWHITKATVIAAAGVPDFKPFTAYKLLCIANKAGAFNQRIFRDLGFAASNRKSSGVFKSWWWSL